MFCCVYIFTVCFFIAKHSGTKGEMDRLEDQFVAGSWAPPFVSPPKKKRKLIKKQDQRQTTKKKETAQKKQKENKTKEKSKLLYI